MAGLPDGPCYFFAALADDPLVGGEPGHLPVKSHVVIFIGVCHAGDCPMPDGAAPVAALDHNVVVAPEISGATPLTVFAERYGIGMTTAYELARTKQLRVVRIGRKPVVLAEDEIAWRKSLPEWEPTAPTDHRRENGRGRPRSTSHQSRTLPMPP